MGSLVNAGVGAMAGQMGFNEALTGMAMNQLGSQVQASGALSWFPYIFLSLQQLFNVGHSYIFRKMILLLCPFMKKMEGQGAPTPVWGDSSSAVSSGAAALGPDGLKVDIETPDLYIPLMSYVTYVLMYGMQRGILRDFRPEVLPSTASFAMVLLFLEVGGAKMGFYLSGSSVPVMDIFANCGYKYVSACLMVLARILLGKSPLYYAFFAYFGACAAWAIRRFLLHFEPQGVQQ
ncbi:unnamed protein product, partial [Polarella glacialis]